MRCADVREMMSLYIDCLLNETEKEEFEKHIEECEECKQEFEILKNMLAECNFEEEELPQGFKEQLHIKLVAEKSKTKKSILGFNTNWKSATGLAAAVLIFAVGIWSLPKVLAPDMAGTGGNQIAVQQNFAADTKGMENLSPEVPKAKMAMTLEADMATTSRMVIRNGYISIQVTDIDLKVSEIKQKTKEIGGYVENSQIDTYEGDPVNKIPASKQANVTIRVPQGNFEDMIKTIKTMGKTTNENVNGSDITTQYRDTATRVENLKIQESSLQQLMTKAKNVDDILRIETELNRVRTDIEIMTSELKNWDTQVQMSSIQINLLQVKEGQLQNVDMNGIWGKVYNSFIQGINAVVIGVEKLIILIAGVLPFLVIAVVLGVLIYIPIRKRSK